MFSNIELLLLQNVCIQFSRKYKVGNKYSKAIDLNVPDVEANKLK